MRLKQESERLLLLLFLFHINKLTGLSGQKAEEGKIKLDGNILRMGSNTSKIENYNYFFVFDFLSNNLYYVSEERYNYLTIITRRIKNLLTKQINVLQKIGKIPCF